MPAGVQICSMMHAVHHHPGYWKDPHVSMSVCALSVNLHLHVLQTFDPSRFARDEHKTAPGMYHPFGYGRRLCIGREMAMAEMQVDHLLV